MIDRIIDFLDRVFAPLTNLLGQGLEFFYSLGTPWWLSIVILTVIVRSLLFPLTIRQVRSMRAMQDLKPEMDRIRAKYKDNREKQQEEIMKLYQERQINPLGSCLPILIQMPVFITMFYVIRGFGDTHPSFTEGGLFWFQDLSSMDPYYILPILSAVTMFASMEITAKNVDPQQRWLMRIMPVGITVFLLTFPAGLFMYWITSNVVTLVQNYVIYNYGPGKKPTSTEKQREQPPNDRSSASETTPGAQNGVGKAGQKAKGGRKKKRKKRR